jgi:tetratricopeptide (TPR) repeat protein
MRRYLDSGRRLAALDPGNFAWQRELGYGYHNLAVLEDAAGRFAEAERQMLAELELYRGWALERPDDRLLRSEMSDVASWLGSLTLRQGRLDEAETYFLEQNELLRVLVTEDPLDARWKQQRHDALLLLADAQAQRGRLDEARATVKAAVEIGAALATQDPSNNYWQLTRGRSRYWQALLASDAQPATSAAIAADATAMLAAAQAAEPQSERLLSWLVRSRNLEGHLALGRGDVAAAREHVAAGRALIEPAWRDTASETLRPWLARTLLLQGEVAARAGDAAAATAAWTEARRLLEGDAGSELPFGRLDPLVRVLQYLGDGDAARPHLDRLEQAGYVPLQPFPERG